MAASFDTAELQIRERRKQVDFDVREFTIEFLVSKFSKGDIFIPEYQRDFVWLPNRQSKFIESIILGIPIPFLFAADVSSDSQNDLNEGNLEIVDGSQRIRTLEKFISNVFPLSDLDILTELNGKCFSDFSSSRRLRFLNTSLKMIVISENSDPEVRFLMFERINTGSEILTNMEQRKGIYAGNFTQFIYEDCAKNLSFTQLTSFTDQVKKRGEAEELILRFFAYSDEYQNFNNTAYSFLNNYLEKKNAENFDKIELMNKFTKMLDFVKTYFPYGFLRYKDSKKPRVRF